MENKYTEKDMIDFGKLCSDNPQIQPSYLFSQWIIPKDVVLNLNKSFDNGQFCACITSVGCNWINDNCICNNCNKPIYLAKAKV